MKKIIGFYNLDELVENKSLLSDLPRDDKWLVLPYETGSFSGRMLCCSESARPEPVELKVGLSGWYKIYVGVINASYFFRTGITLGDKGKTVLVPPSSGAWGATEYGHRMFYRAADMTGQTITISKSGPYFDNSSSISFLEFEEMTEEEIAEYTKTEGGDVFYHFDEGLICEVDYEKDSDYLGCFNMLEGSHGGILAVESVSASKVFGEVRDMGIPFTNFISKSFDNLTRYRAERRGHKERMIKRAHELGFEIYSASRIGMGDYQLPLAREMVETFAVYGNEALCVENRDGRVVPTLSYAYEKVRQMSVESVIYSTDDLDYDGISLTLHRGVFFGFEEPVRKAVMEKYGVDARRLLASDHRLNEVWCDYFTEYLRTLRGALDERYGKGTKKINVIVFSDPVSCRNFGYDVERWIDEGLIDNVSQGLMKWWEELDDCLDGEGLIDLEKYSEVIKYRAPVKREYKFNDPTELIEGAKEFMKICEPIQPRPSIRRGNGEESLRVRSGQSRTAPIAIPFFS